jgi:glutaminase
MDGEAQKKGGGFSSPVTEAIDDIYRRHLAMRGGALPTYIPELSKVEPDSFAISLAMTDGHVYAAGDDDVEFTIQSISKAFVYGLALRDNGVDAISERIGVAPSGDSFNAINFDNAKNRPFNPMVNAGALVATSLIGGYTPDQRLQRILDLFGACAGRPLAIDEAVYRSESRTGHRNRAIAHLELSAGMIEGDIDQHLDLYFKQCSIKVTARDLAVMAATLANGGVNPVTGVRAMQADHVRHVLSVMTTCGMYDYAGEWEFEVGLPAKSGVGGGIMAVLPGELGLGVFSPRLDGHGNSVRGVGVCRDIAARLKLHMLDYRGAVRSPVRRRYRGDQVRSTRTRPAAARRALDGLAGSIVLFELQGDLRFANMEVLTRDVIAALPGASHIILDARRVSSIGAVAHDMLGQLRRHIVEAGCGMLFVPASDPAGPPPRGDEHTAPDIDSALESAESELLRRAGFDTDDASAQAALEEFDFLHHFEPAEIDALRRYLTPVALPAQAAVIAEGDEADRIYFLTKGAVEARIGAVRLGTIEAGNAFGEVALLGESRRTASVWTRTPVEASVLTVAAAADLFRDEPNVHRKLLLAVGRSLSERLHRANIEIRAHAP